MKVAILMSTFNGEKFIEKQIRSIQRQTYTDWKLYIHDDGSSDQTKEIIKNLKEDDNRIIFPIEEGNFKPKDAFFKLLKKVDADYYFLCDQDDLWESQKIEKMLTEVKNKTNNKPFLVYSNVKCIDVNDKPIDDFKNFEKQVSTNISKFNYVHMNNIPGCSMMLNRALRDIVFREKEKLIRNANIIMHDWWIALVAASFGEIIHTNENLVLYRQHSNNTLGAGNSMNLIQELFNIGVIKLFRNAHFAFKRSLRQTKEFYKLYLLNEKNIYNKFIVKYINYNRINFIQKIKFMNEFNLHKISKKGNVAFKLVFLFSKR